MITPIKDLPEDIIGFKFKGKITAKDYETVLMPALKAAVKKSKDLKVLCQMTKSFESFSIGAAWDDMQIGMKYLHDWKKVAFVSDKKWLKHTVSAFGFLIPGHVRTFSNSKQNEALKWLQE